MAVQNDSSVASLPRDDDGHGIALDVTGPISHVVRELVEYLEREGHDVTKVLDPDDRDHVMITFEPTYHSVGTWDVKRHLRSTPYEMGGFKVRNDGAFFFIKPE